VHHQSAPDFRAVGVTGDHDYISTPHAGKQAQLSYGDADFWREKVAEKMGYRTQCFVSFSSLVWTAVMVSSAVEAPPVIPMNLCPLSQDGLISSRFR